MRLIVFSELDAPWLELSPAGAVIHAGEVDLELQLVGDPPDIGCRVDFETPNKPRRDRNALH